MISAEKKRKRGVKSAEELGALIDGENATVGPSGERLLKLIHSTLWILGNKHLSKKKLQIVAGRWIHVLQFRRPAMSFLEATWKFISSKQFNLDMVGAVRRELFALIAAAPLLHTHLGAKIADFATASDASMGGGAAGISHELNKEGHSYVAAMLHSQQQTQVIPVLVLSLFNGIGGSFRCYDVLGLCPQCLVSFDTHKPSNRVTSRRWPHALIYLDVKSLNREMVLEWLLKNVGIREIHIWGGFPCTDLSSAKAGGLGLAGPQSSLFFELVRIIQLVKEVAEPLIKMKFVAENVASMAKSECEAISEHLGMEPYFLNCSDAVPMSRPRLAWTNETVEGALEGLEFHQERHWKTIKAEAPYPLLSDWLEPGFEWPGYADGEVLPTAMKAIVRQVPPLRPAGLHRCNNDARGRWAAEWFKFPPYHYLDRFIFWKGEKWKIADSIERELLLGYGYLHTSLCFSASRIKQSKAAYENERLSQLGDSFSIYSFVILAAALSREFVPKIEYKHLAARMGLAPGYRAPWRLVAPVKRCLQYGFDNGIVNHFPHELSRILLTRVNHTGSDVRISTGEILNYKAFPRQGVEAAWWKWEPAFKFKWRHEEHINILELRAILQSVIHTLQQTRLCDFRLLHLTDSYVCLSIIGKGRSGSRVLNRVLKLLNAHLLLYGIYLIMSHVESAQNPTDEASRET